MIEHNSKVLIIRGNQLPDIFQQPEQALNNEQTRLAITSLIVSLRENNETLLRDDHAVTATFNRGFPKDHLNLIPEQLHPQLSIKPGIFLEFYRSIDPAVVINDLRSNYLRYPHISIISSLLHNIPHTGIVYERPEQFEESNLYVYSGRISRHEPQDMIPSDELNYSIRSAIGREVIFEYPEE